MPRLAGAFDALRDGTRPDMDILIDLNFNTRPEGFLQFLLAIADLDISCAIDSYRPRAQAVARAHHARFNNRYDLRG